MDAFKFNFNEPDDAESQKTFSSEETGGSKVMDTTSAKQAERYVPIPKSSQELRAEELLVDGLTFKVVQVGGQVAGDGDAMDEDVGELAEVIARTDILNGVYEGGLKVWECSIDLLRYLQRHKSTLPFNCTIELGCGHGLPGIFALQQGARTVFSDYNKEVLALATHPNVLLNAIGQSSEALYYFGDWKGLPEKLAADLGTIRTFRFDLILSADTLYTEETTRRLFTAILDLLSENGTALIGAKRYYFGTGGSVQDFMDLVEADGRLKAEVVEHIEDGHSNIREIVQAGGDDDARKDGEAASLPDGVAKDRTPDDGQLEEEGEDDDDEEEEEEEEEEDDEEAESGESGSEETSWIQWFCSLRGNEFFCEVEEDFIQDDFNLTGLSSMVPYYDYAMDMILDLESPYENLSDQQQEMVESAAEMLYGLIHARYVLTSRGMQAMLQKYSRVDFGRCLRVYCQGQPVLPVGQSDIPRNTTVNVFCPKCHDIYFPKSSRQGNIDGAYFGTSFPHIFLMTYPDLIPTRSTQMYIPRVYGFKVHQSSPFYSQSLTSTRSSRPNRQHRRSKDKKEIDQAKSAALGQ